MVGRYVFLSSYIITENTSHQTNCTYDVIAIVPITYKQYLKNIRKSEGIKSIKNKSRHNCIFKSKIIKKKVWKNNIHK